MSRFQYYRPNQMPPVVKNLIIVNVLVFFAQQVFDGTGPLGPRGEWLTRILALYPVGYGFKPYQLITHMFAHANFGHILFNMFALWTFGKMLEIVWGPKRFLTFYLLCGIGAALAHLLVQQLTGPDSFALGASGAVMGLFAAFAYLFPNTELYLMFLPIAIRAKWVVLLLAAYDLFGGLGYFGASNIAHFAHLGGALTGFIIVLVWQKSNRRKFY